MELFIRIKDGQPFEHPIVGDNFRQAFPNVNANNLPFEFARFEKTPSPTLGAYEVYEGVTYELVDGVCKDVHHVRSMTSEEITSKQQMAKDVWAVNGFASWVFDEENCSFNPPIAYPNDDKIYRWDEPTISWVEVNNA